MIQNETIHVRYSSIDGHSERRRFKLLRNAKLFAHKWVGEHPEIGSRYAASGDGVGKIECAGCTLAELFPEPGAARVMAKQALDEAVTDASRELDAIVDRS
jgi:hypothetical protein